MTMLDEIRKEREERKKKSVKQIIKEIDDCLEHNRQAMEKLFQR
jgi:hypothetical protein